MRRLWFSTSEKTSISVPWGFPREEPAGKSHISPFIWTWLQLFTSGKCLGDSESWPAFPPRGWWVNNETEFLFSAELLLLLNTRREFRGRGVEVSAFREASWLCTRPPPHADVGLLGFHVVTVGLKIWDCQHAPHPTTISHDSRRVTPWWVTLLLWNLLHDPPFSVSLHSLINGQFYAL